MGDFVDALVRVFEILAQGALAAAVAGYVIAWAHPLKRWISEHAFETSDLLLEQWPATWRKPAAAIVIIGAVYYAGVITNVAGYWALDPLHERVLRYVEFLTAPSDSASAPAVITAAPVPPGFRESFTLLVRDRQVARTRAGAYLHYIRDETVWRIKHLDSVKHAIDPLLKQVRIIRGTAVCILCFAVFATLRVIYFLAFALTFTRWSTATRAKIYHWTVDPKMGSPSIKKVQATLLVHAAYLAMALVAYYLILQAYIVVEREYHVMVEFGAQVVTVQ